MGYVLSSLWYLSEIEGTIYEELSRMDDIALTERRIKDLIQEIKNLLDNKNYKNGNHYLNFITGYTI